MFSKRASSIQIQWFHSYSYRPNFPKPKPQRPKFRLKLYFVSAIVGAITENGRKLSNVYLMAWKDFFALLSFSLVYDRNRNRKAWAALVWEETFRPKTICQSSQRPFCSYTSLVSLHFLCDMRPSLRSSLQKHVLANGPLSVLFADLPGLPLRGRNMTHLN